LSTGGKPERRWASPVNDEIETLRRRDREGFRGGRLDAESLSEGGFELEPIPNLENSALFSANFASPRFDEIIVEVIAHSRQVKQQGEADSESPVCRIVE
jgi:hypothetical protein